MKKLTFAPINSRIVLAASISVFGPPSINDKVPAVAAPTPPETGESMKMVRFSLHCSDTFFATAGSMVEQSRKRVPGEAVDCGIFLSISLYFKIISFIITIVIKS